jgi:hypothetical protein
MTVSTPVGDTKVAKVLIPNNEAWSAHLSRVGELGNSRLDSSINDSVNGFVRLSTGAEVVRDRKRLLL